MPLRSDDFIERVGKYGPACFNDVSFPVRNRRTNVIEIKTEYELWKDAARDAPPKSCKGHPWCTDCTQEYQYEMIRQYRCNHPGVQFKEDKDGFLAGFDPGRDYD